MTLEDPTQLARCIHSDCDHYRAGASPFCARHLREQEVQAGATSIVEPELEARVANVRTEDDDRPGMVKVYDRETGAESWVPEAPKANLFPPPPALKQMADLQDEADRRALFPEIYVGPDPDVNGDGVVLPKDGFGVSYVPIPEDPTKAQAKLFKKALRGKLGPLAQRLAETTINTIGDIAE